MKIMLLLILGMIDIIAGGIIFINQSIGIVNYVGLVLIWKGIITIFYYIKSKVRRR